MRSVFIDDGRSTAALDESFENPFDIRAFHATGQLAVAEAARASLAEQIVVLSVERAAAIEVAHGGNPFLHGQTPFQDQRTIAFLREVIAREQPGGTGADDDRSGAHRQLTGRGIVERWRCEDLHVVTQSSLHGRRLQHVLGQIDQRRVDEPQIGRCSRVEALLENTPPRERLDRNTQSLGEISRQFGFWHRDRQPQVRDTQRH